MLSIWKLNMVKILSINSIIANFKVTMIFLSTLFITFLEPAN